MRPATKKHSSRHILESLRHKRTISLSTDSPASEMSDHHECFTEAELDTTLNVYLLHKATRPMAEFVKIQYMEGKTNTSEFLEVTAVMTESLLETTSEKGAPTTDIKKVMDMEDKWKETWEEIKAAKDPLEGYKIQDEIGNCSASDVPNGRRNRYDSAGVGRDKVATGQLSRANCRMVFHVC
ncbi:hypothetical protein LBRM_03_0020 [Leishmania braziliensis MHOM/BR/75/M2904]|uniref:Uncharacterized protein n=1 Tax=Leishmania braziliensis TaxID=5660 RepID=A4H3H3_LEIBR|nr:hypothetical protein LBRM_03_0020 [Leishmania braziliensis MHOM/BR/75/M2904]CAJ2465835.1 unnamed protein product [Leishmania braziliensis]CAM36738.1 hypothetical protein LBRM_03_0020 [Leishmania braziliensis MHOM/BR/75/M2904]